MTDNNQSPMIIMNYTDYDNFTEEEFLESILGPKHLPLKLVLPVTVIYLLIFVTGVFGNVVTCVVIIRNPIMQTATNHYLFNLAVSDLMLLVLGLPNELWVFWQQYPWELGLAVCKGRAFASEMSSYVSVLTIVAFSLERYLAICHPLRLFVMSGLKRHIIIIAVVWIVALVFAIPFCWYTEVNYIEWPPHSRNISRISAICAMLNMPHFPLYEMSCVIFFLVPMVIIMWLYIHMGIAIQRKTLGNRIDGTIHGKTRPSQSRKAIIRMLSAVVVTFFICWAPFHVQRLLWVYTDNHTFALINEWLYPLAGSLYYFSTTINPILYNVMSAKYRRAFKQTLCCSNSFNRHTDVDLSSVREIEFSRCGSFYNSHMVRIQSVCKSRTLNRCKLKNVRDNLNSSLKDDENENHHHYNGNGSSRVSVPLKSNHSPKRVICETKKSSMMLHSRNGQTKCHANEERDRRIVGETRI